MLELGVFSEELHKQVGKEVVKNEIDILITVGKDEIQAMINEDHGCEMTCHFCNTKYQFSEEELTELLTELS